MTTAAEAQDRVEQLIAVTRRLTDLLAAETRAFEARRAHDAALNMEEVARLANIYRRESARIRQEPTLIAGASDAKRALLMQLTQSFEAVLARHGRALAAAKTITEGLVHAIAEEVASAMA